MGVSRIFADEDDGEREEQGEDDADRIVIFDEACLAEELHERDGDDADERSTEEQPRRAEIMREKECEHDPEQHRVTDRVRHHRETAQDEKDAKRSACCRRQEEYEECVIHFAASV